MSEKETGKTVPERDLLAIKAKLRAAEAKLETLERENKILKSEDDDLDGVKKYLLDKEDELAKKESEFTEKETDFSGREKSVRAKELASKYNIDAEALLVVENMELEAERLRADNLAKALEDKNKQEELGGGIYESGTPAIATKTVANMSNDEFNAYVKKQRDEALNRR